MAPVEIRDVAPGLWLWRMEYPDWRPGVGWGPLVASTCVESRGEVALLDPLAPPADAADVWSRLDERPPTMVVTLKPDHVRDVDLFVGTPADLGVGRPAATGDPLADGLAELYARRAAGALRRPHAGRGTLDR